MALSSLSLRAIKLSISASFAHLSCPGVDLNSYVVKIDYPAFGCVNGLKLVCCDMGQSDVIPAVRRILTSGINYVLEGGLLSINYVFKTD